MIIDEKMRGDLLVAQEIADSGLVNDFTCGLEYEYNPVNDNLTVYTLLENGELIEWRDLSNAIEAENLRKTLEKWAEGATIKAPHQKHDSESLPPA